MVSVIFTNDTLKAVVSILKLNYHTLNVLFTMKGLNYI